jgi:hypothetical protein
MQCNYNSTKFGSPEGELARKILRGSHEASMQRHGGTKEGFEPTEKLQHGCQKSSEVLTRTPMER